MIKYLAGSIGQFTPTMVADFTKPAWPAGLTFSRNTVASFINQAGALQVATAGQPRLDFDPLTLASRGLLLEESRTNYVPNSELNGAVVGGSLPTGWSFTTGTHTVLNIYTDEQGRKVISLRLQANNTAGASSIFPRLRIVNAMPAAPGQTWTATALLKSATTNLPLSLLVEEAGGSPYAGTNVDITGQAGKVVSNTRTLTNAATNRVSMLIGANVPAGGSWECTLELATPQFEQGAYQTTYIPTTSTVAVTRAYESLSGQLGEWFNRAGGTFLVEWATDQAGILLRPFTLDDTTLSNRIVLSRLATGTLQAFGVVEGADFTGNQFGAGYAATTGLFKSAIRIGANDYQLATNDALNGSTGQGAFPAITRFVSSTSRIWLRSIRYYPGRFPNPYLKAITAL